MINIYLHLIIGFYYIVFISGFALVVRGLFYKKILASIVGVVFIWNSTYMLREFFHVVKEIY